MIHHSCQWIFLWRETWKLIPLTCCLFTSILCVIEVIWELISRQQQQSKGLCLLQKFLKLWFIISCSSSGKQGLKKLLLSCLWKGTRNRDAYQTRAESLETTNFAWKLLHLTQNSAWQYIATLILLTDKAGSKQLSSVAILLYRLLSCWCLETSFTYYQACSLLFFIIFFWLIRSLVYPMLIGSILRMQALAVSGS